MNSQQTALIDDVVFQILQFMDTKTLVKVCKKVSRQFYQESLKIPLCLVFSQNDKFVHQIKLQHFCATNKNSVAELSAPRSYIKSKSDIIDDIKWIVTNQKFDQLTKLDLSTIYNRGQIGVGDEGVKLIASSKFFPHLQSLNLSFGSITDEGVKYLVESNSRNITELDLSYNYDITEMGIELLLRSSIIENLKYLKLPPTHIRVELLSHLSTCKQLNNLIMEGCKKGALKILLSNENLVSTLKSLSLMHLETSKEEFKILAESKFENLEELVLTGARPLRCAQAKLIASNPYMSKLKKLLLNYAAVGKEGAIAIANSPYLTNLTELNLAAFEGIGGPITGEAAKAIANSENMKNLTNLQLGYSSLRDEGVKAIATSKYMSNLTRLGIGAEEPSLGVTCDSLLTLATSDFMKNIRTLDVSDNDIGTEGLRIIMENMCLTSIRLQYAKITDESIKVLTTCPNSSHLRTLFLSNNEISNDGVKYLAECEYLFNLTDLKFQTDEISDEGLKHIALSHNLQNLTNLEMYQNNCSFEGLNYFFENTKLLKLISLNLETQNEISTRENEILVEKAFAILPLLCKLTIQD